MPLDFRVFSRFLAITLSPRQFVFFSFGHRHGANLGLQGFWSVLEFALIHRAKNGVPFCIENGLDYGFSIG